MAMDAPRLITLSAQYGPRRHPHDTGWRRLPCWLIQCVEQGPYRARFEDGQIDLRPGEAWIIPPGLLNRIGVPKSGSKIHTAWCHALCSLSDGCDLVARYRLPRHLPRTQAVPLVAALQRVIATPIGDTPRQHIASERARLELFDVLLSLAQPLPPDAGQDPRIAAVIAAVHRDPAAAWTRAGLARIAGLSPSRFHDTFCAILAVAPMLWLRRLRMDRAKMLMLSSADPIARIAAQVGFADPYHFARVFHQIEGTSPGRWRRRNAG